MQKDIRKRVKLYGFTAILLAIILASICYQLGYIPQANVKASAMLTFSSKEELAGFLRTRTTSQSGYPYYTYQSNLFFGAPGMKTMAPANVQASEVSGGQTNSQAASDEYSVTNNQVAGVDEADFVKNDGAYIYVMGNDNVSIVRAYPASQAGLVSTITFDNVTPAGIYIGNNRLVLIANNFSTPEPLFSPSMYRDSVPYFTDIQTFAEIYDVTDKADPQLLATVNVTGSYFDSRMEGNYVYVVSSQPAYYRCILNNTVTNQLEEVDKVNIPTIQVNNNSETVSPTTIYYSNSTVTDNYFMFTTVTAINVQNVNEQPATKTLMIGGASTIYVSSNDIFITYPKYGQMAAEVNAPNSNQTFPPLTSIPGSASSSGSSEKSSNATVADGTITLGPPITTSPITPVPIMISTEQTSICRIHFEGSSITPEAQGNVPGFVLNQFSMDQTGDYFRIVTTTWQNGTSTSVYVLNMNMTAVGSLTGLGQGENFHSARFMGNRCYLVTFQTTDPLFVIDLSNPNNPTVLGQLVIPGYSDYLHPYDENHIIGIGKEAVATDQQFAWYQGVKVAVFDVTNVAKPTQMCNYTIGDRGTSSEALDDHKAFLFDKQQSLLVIPIDLYLIPGQTPATGPTNSTIVFNNTQGQSFDNSTNANPPSTYGEFVWQGAYVFNITLDQGLILKGTITHITDNSTNMWSQNNLFIRRSIYIQDVLYTISEAKIQLNNLTNLALIKEISLN
jgi:uncharacterized secreted protein with C-terminal beta-propeller domain